MKINIQHLGKRFGEQVKEYQKGRRVYPPEVFGYLKSILVSRKPKILDIGCGTGISTRQLTKIGEVFGCDPDKTMLAAAKKHIGSKTIKYVIGSTQKLPFKNESFDLVTAFASFHWFDDKKSTDEILRVLKPGGLFFIAGRNGIKSWGQGYRNAIMKAIQTEIADFKKNKYKPERTLKENGFEKIRIKTWKKSEIYSLKNVLVYVKSVSIWNSVPTSLRQKAVVGLKDYFQNLRKRKGRIERKLTLKVVVGFKPK